MSLAIAVSTVLVLVAVRGEVANFVTSTAVCPGLQVVWTVSTNMAHVTTHEAEVVHVNDWGGCRVCRGVLQLGGVRDEGEENSGSKGRGADCGCSVEEVCVNQTLVGVVVILPASGAGMRAGLVLPLAFPFPFFVDKVK